MGEIKAVSTQIDMDLWRDLKKAALDKGEPVHVLLGEAIEEYLKSQRGAR